MSIDTAPGTTLQEIRSNLHAQKLAIVRECSLPCTECKKYFILSSSDFVQDHYHSGPLHPTGGGRWYPSEPNTCSLRCPHCGQLNYIYTHPESRLIILLVAHLGFKKEELFRRILNRKGMDILEGDQVLSPAMGD
jgi:hypothetical protein